MAQEDFLSKLFREEDVQVKVAEAEEEFSPERKAVLDKAYARLEKLAADLSAEGVTVPAFEDLSSDEQNSILNQAIDEILAEGTADADATPETAVATDSLDNPDELTVEAMNKIAVAEEFGQFLGYKMYRADFGIEGRTQRMLEKAAGADHIDEVKQAAVDLLKNRGVEKKACLDEVPMTPAGIQKAASDEEWMGRHTVEVTLATYNELKKQAGDDSHPIVAGGAMAAGGAAGVAAAKRYSSSAPVKAVADAAGKLGANVNQRIGVSLGADTMAGRALGNPGVKTRLLSASHTALKHAVPVAAATGGALAAYGLYRGAKAAFGGKKKE